LKYSNENNIESFSVERYDVCSGCYDGSYSEWNGIMEKFRAYQDNTEWHNSIAEFWNKYYGGKCDKKDFIIFFYESLYPIFLDKYCR